MLRQSDSKSAVPVDDNVITFTPRNGWRAALFAIFSRRNSSQIDDLVSHWPSATSPGFSLSPMLAQQVLGCLLWVSNRLKSLLLKKEKADETGKLPLRKERNSWRVGAGSTVAVNIILAMCRLTQNNSGVVPEFFFDK